MHNPNHEDNLMSNTMNTLDKFGFCELADLNSLIQAYADAGAHANGKIYADLPKSWHDDGVCIDFNPDSGLVFLINSEYQVLIRTKYGVMMWYTTPHANYEGTLFDLADLVRADLSDSEGYTLPAGAGNWHKEDLLAIYGYLDEDLDALRDTGADLDELYRAKYRIAMAFVKASLTDAPLSQDELDCYSDNELIAHCLPDFGREIADDDFYKYVGFIRQTMLKLNAE